MYQMLIVIQRRHNFEGMYRYTDIHGKRQTIYSSDLKELREKEKVIQKEDFGYRQIRDIKVSDAQQWIMKLHNDGKGYSTITSARGVVKPAFQMAYNEDIKEQSGF